MGRLGPEDLPEDPFGAGGMAQLICGCTSERFLFIYTATAVRAVCAQCQAQAGEFPRTSSPITPAGEPRTEPMDVVGPGRDMLSGHSSPHVGAAWDTPGPGTPDTNPELPARQDPPPLPAFSPGICNTYLRGGPYDGQITALVSGTTEFIIGQVATYRSTDEVHEGRIVYLHQE